MAKESQKGRSYLGGSPVAEINLDMPLQGTGGKEEDVPPKRQGSEHTRQNDEGGKCPA